MSAKSFLSELRRRNVIRAAVLYIGAVWALAQGIAQLGPVVGAPDWVARWFLVAAVIGFPFWIAFAWFFEFTPEGLKRESEIEPADSITAHTSKKLDRWIIAIMGVAIVLLLTNTFVWHKGAGLSADADTAPVVEHSIAVLPFVNMSDDKSNEYFSDGISEELLNLLAKIPQLQVTARTSSFSFKGKNTAIPEIARTLHVAHVLEGSVRKSGNAVRITAQLIRAGTDTHLWSQTYDRKLDDIFAIQDEIAADVVKALKVTLLGEVPKTRATNPEAYALFLQSSEIARPNTPEALAASDALLRRALEIDPKYVPAWDGLTRNAINRAVTSVQGTTSLEQRAEAFVEARRLTEQVLALDPNYARTHGRLGAIAMNCCDDLRGAVQHFQRSLDLDPRDTVTLANASTVLRSLGRIDQEIAIREALLRRDPVNLTGLFNLATSQRIAGRYDESIASYRTVLSLAPNRAGARRLLAVTQLLKGEPQAALPEFERDKEEYDRLYDTALAYHALGRKTESDAALAALTAKYEADSSFQIAAVHAFRGEADQAFAWLDKAAGRKDHGLTGIHLEPFLNRIHSDPRWLPFLRKLGKAPEQLAQIAFEIKIPASIDDAVARDAPAARP